ncbi:hypothetical protein PLAN_40350 [Planktothrix rubescens CCAP 1459/22]|uniref:Uncharacterized protein n=1 Tax=Planktothrix rubescens CCAP 1459/22 TaxID=329571 RepID=A0A6J7ZJ71_PLARU|nr:hypothetical protein PLAN_40350 [Planktothrix rubescens NIVA-CYA 18]CAD0227042.1 hypothetical protein PL10110_300087 [Planktothrix agardhii]
MCKNFKGDLCQSDQNQSSSNFSIIPKVTNFFQENIGYLINLNQN